MALNRDQSGRPSVLPPVFRENQPNPVEDCPRNAEIDEWLAGPLIRGVKTKSDGGRIVEVPQVRKERAQTIASWAAKQIGDSNKWRVSIATLPSGQSRDFIVVKETSDPVAPAEDAAPLIVAETAQAPKK
jgi:hypothetical protein